MRRRLRVVLVVLIAALGFAGTDEASAQVTPLDLFGLGLGRAGQPISLTAVEARFSGSVIVTFHGDRAAGCAANGVCGYSGAIVWRASAGPNSTRGALEIEKLRRARHVVDEAQITASADSIGDVGVSAVVRRDVPAGTPGTCADVSQPDSRATLRIDHGSILLQVLGPGSSLFTTRCAGPRDVDLAGAMPADQLALEAVASGHRTVDLSGTHDFSAGGFVGTLHSTLVLHLGAAETVSARRSTTRRRKRARGDRIVTEPVTIAAASGALSFGVRGSREPDVCAVLDSCGSHGTLTIAPRPDAAHGELFAVGPANRPYRDFLAALGLSRRGRAKGILALGLIIWNGGGTTSTTISGAGQCADSSVLGSGVVLLLVRREKLVVEYGPAGSLPLRCPGLDLGAAIGDGPLASGTAPQSLRRLTVHLRAPRSLSDDGYSASGTGVVAFTLQPGRLSQEIVSP